MSESTRSQVAGNDARAKAVDKVIAAFERFDPELGRQWREARQSPEWDATNDTQVLALAGRLHGKLRAERLGGQRPTARRTPRTPRRPRPASRRTTRVDSDDGAPPEPPPEYADQSELARLGLARSGRHAVALLKRKGIPYSRDGRRYLVRLSDVLRALGLESLPTVQPEPSRPQWSADRVVLRLLRGGAK